MRAFLIFLSLLSSHTYAETIYTQSHDSNTSKRDETQCRCVCDKKLSNEEKLSQAIEFYKNSKIYTFIK